MKPFIKKIAAGLLLFVFTVCALQVPAEAAQVNAASKNYMKNLKGVKWDLKKGKKVTVKTMFFGVGLKDESWKITNLKIKDSKMEGYKEMTFSFIAKTEYQPDEEEVDDLTDNISNDGYLCNSSRFSFVDYSTGLRADRAKGFDVTVTSKWSTLKKKQYQGTHENVANLYDNQCDVKVIFPKDYDGLCLGVMGSPLRVDNSMDEKYLEGKVPFGKTSYYKKAKNNTHWIRIRNLIK